MFDSPEADAKVRAQDSTAAKILKEVNDQIHRHEDADKTQSYLAIPFDYLYGKDERSLTELKKIQKELDKELKSGDADGVLKKSSKVNDAIKSDQKALQVQDRVSGVGRTLVTTVPLFMTGAGAVVGTVVAFGLDRATPKTSLNEQAVDFTLGGLQGAAMKYTVGLGKFIPGGLAGRSVGLGMMNRLTGLALNRSTYRDSATGEYSAECGLSNTVKGTVNPVALATDVATFAIAGGAFHVANKHTADLLMRSPLISTTLTGGVYGFAGGAGAELARQVESKEPIRLSKAIQSGSEKGLVAAIASIPGGIQGQMKLDTARRLNLEELKQKKQPNEKVYTQEGYIAVEVDGKPLGWERQLGDGDQFHTTKLRFDRGYTTYKPKTWVGPSLKVYAGVGEQTRLNGKPLDDGSSANVTIGDVIEYLPEPGASQSKKVVIGTMPWTQKFENKLQGYVRNGGMVDEPRIFALWDRKESWGVPDYGKEGLGFVAGMDQSRPYVMDTSPLSSSIFAPDRLHVNGKPVPSNTRIPLTKESTLEFNGYKYSFLLQYEEVAFPSSNDPHLEGYLRAPVWGPKQDEGGIAIVANHNEFYVPQLKR